MKRLTKIALSVALMSVIVLSIVVASVAWFTSNPEVGANDVTLNAARTLNVTFDQSVAGTTFRYVGQKGTEATGDHAPYVYEAGGFTVRIDTLSSDVRRGRIKVEFGTVTITYPTGSVADVLITDLFHVTASIYRVNQTTGGYVKDPVANHFREYVSATDGGLTRYMKAIEGLTISDDGVLMNGNNEATFDEHAFELAFTFTFLPDAMYQVWLDACNGTDSFDNIYGYEREQDGGYVGMESYTAYKAKYHYKLQRYTRSGTEGNYTYTANAEGAYVRAVTSYQAYASVTKYDAQGNISANGEYIKLGDSNEYVRYRRYNRVPGFPYAGDKYRGEKFTFKVSCTVEEV